MTKTPLTRFWVTRKRMIESSDENQMRARMMRPCSHRGWRGFGTLKGRGGPHEEGSGPPGEKAGEESPEGSERLVGPDVDRALAGEHQAELASHDGAGDEECEEAEDPVDESGGAG